MTERLTRRGWIKTVGAATAAATLCRPGYAIDPFKRPHGPRMKLSLAAYSFRGLLTGRSPRWTLDDFIDFCAEQQLDGTELTSYYFPSPVTPQYLNHLKQKCFLLGLDISGTAIRNVFTHPPGPDRDRELAHVRRWIDYAAGMGAPVIRIFSGGIPRGHTLQKARRWCIETIEAACDYAGSRGVFLALENHGGISTTAEDILAIVRDVRSDWFGVNLDTGNFRSKDPYRDIELVAPFAVNVQVKVEIRPEGSARQRADFQRIVRILRSVDYRGYLVLEYEAAEPPLRAVPRYLAELREAMAA